MTEELINDLKNREQYGIMFVYRLDNVVEDYINSNGGIFIRHDYNEWQFYLHNILFITKVVSDYCRGYRPKAVIVDSRLADNLVYNILYPQICYKNCLILDIF